MPTEPTVPLTYQEADVVSAQRLRFRTSTRLRVIGVMGIAGLVTFSVQRINPALFGPPPGDGNWAGPMVIAATFVLVPLLVYFVAPILDYRMNRNWRLEASLNYSETGLRITVPEIPRPLDLDWAEVRKVLENDRVFVFFVGRRQDFLVIPKRIFPSQEQLESFRSRIAAVGAARAAGKP